MSRTASARKMHRHPPFTQPVQPRADPKQACEQPVLHNPISIPAPNVGSIIHAHRSAVYCAFFRWRQPRKHVRFVDPSITFGPVSATDIIRALPRLSEQERRAIRQVLLDIANQDEDIAACNEAALQGALMLDRLENEDAQRKSR